MAGLIFPVAFHIFLYETVFPIAVMSQHLETSDVFIVVGEKNNYIRKWLY